MGQDYLNKLEKIEPVLVPDFLMDGIKNKIEAKRVTDKRNGNFTLVLAFILLLANVGVISSYNSKGNSNNTANVEVNPYSFNQSSFIEYD